MKGKSRHTDEKSAVDILEEATGLLRSRPILLTAYYIGSLPFVLGILYFVTHMSVAANAWRHCPQAAWGLALLFIWMKTWQSIYANRILVKIKGESNVPQGLSCFFYTACIQTALQPWSFIILPLCFLIMLPFPQSFAFFNNVLIAGFGNRYNFLTVVQKSWHLAAFQPMQNTLIIWLASPFLLICANFIILLLTPLVQAMSPWIPPFLLIFAATLAIGPFCPLGVITATNIGFALLTIPWLLKTFFDIETVFSTGKTYLFNYTFFAVVCGLTYLCLDPLLKAAYCLRFFYGESVKTGEDLKIEFPLSGKSSAKAPIIMLCFFSFLFAGSALAEISPPSVVMPAREAPVSAQQLDTAIERTINRPEYTWRMPREKPVQKDKGNSAFHAFLRSVAELLKSGMRYLKKSITRVMDWILDMISRIIPSLPPLKKPDQQWSGLSKAFIFIPIICIVVMFIFFAWRAWKYRKEKAITALTSVNPVPDISSDDIDATALPEDEWLKLAGDLQEKGELRLALRALYLAMLVSLSNRDLITLAKYKSDREYEMELQRRSHTVPRLSAIFAENRSLFEGAWYGMREVTISAMERFSRNMDEMVIDAEG